MRSIPYTLQSFIELAGRENSRGKDISRLDAEVGRATRAMRLARKQHLRELASDTLDDAQRERLRSEYRASRREMHETRDDAVENVLRAALASFEEKLSRREFVFGLTAGPSVGGKPTFQVDAALEVAYPAKQAAHSIQQAARAETSSRNSLVRALQSALMKPYEHAVFKLDIEAFFESIPHAALRDRLARCTGLDNVSMELAGRLLAEYGAISATTTGLPRGVGMSSQLAELYMHDFDSQLKTHPGVLFYARYVDDVIMVLESEQVLMAVKLVATEALQALCLKPNASKTYDIVSDPKGDYPAGVAIEYLGYTFAREGGELRTGLTDKRKERRKRRLELALQAWLDTAPNAVWPNHGHNGVLLDRVRYLAGNTKLLNSKSNVAIGLYFSNSALDQGSAELTELDAILTDFCTQNATRMPDKFRNRLESVSFERMFASKEFLRFPRKRIERIVSVWESVG